MIIDNVENIDVDLVYNQLYKLFSVKSDRALSMAMGLSESAVRTARGRDSLPWAGVISACKKKGISLDEAFDIEVIKTNESINNTQPNGVQQQSKGLTAKDLLAVNTMVDKVLDEVLLSKNLPLEQELRICKKLKPLLIETAFEYDFNEIFVKVTAEGAVRMV